MNEKQKILAKQFGKRLKEQREKKNFTQQQLAYEVNIDPTTLSRYERGAASPQITVLLEIARILDSDIKEFFA